jgi:hypothetical protein
VRYVPLALAWLAVGLTGCLGNKGPADDAPSSDPAAALYSQAATEACLRDRGASIRRLRPLDAQLRALRDLAQHRSLEVHLDDALVGAGFAPDIAGAQLLVELLQVPSSPYAVVRRGNVVVLHEPTDDAAFQVVSACLRS